VKEDCALFDGLWAPGERHQVWMSHGDKVDALPAGFRIVAQSDGRAVRRHGRRRARNSRRPVPPEVVHTPDGGKLIANFVRHVCGLAGDWTMAEFRDTKIARYASRSARAG
jgi:GMP synthase (glutamine-hydrolysing)